MNVICIHIILGRGDNKIVLWILSNLLLMLQLSTWRSIFINLILMIFLKLFFRSVVCLFIIISSSNMIALKIISYYAVCINIIMTILNISLFIGLTTPISTFVDWHKKHLSILIDIICIKIRSILSPMWFGWLLIWGVWLLFLIYSFLGWKIWWNRWFILMLLIMIMRKLFLLKLF